MAQEPTSSDAVATQEEGALRIIKRSSLWAAGAGVLPAPGLDTLAVTGIQVKLIKDLADLFGTEFEEQKTKSIITALIGALSARALAMGFLGSFLKAIPGPGTLIGILTMPIIAGAITYAVGQVFAKHFQAGGTIDNLRAADFTEFADAKFKEGKEFVKSSHKKGEAEEAA